MVRLVFGRRRKVVHRFIGIRAFALERFLAVQAGAGFGGCGIEATAVLQEVVPRGAFEAVALPKLVVKADIAELTGDELQPGQVVRLEI